jgi:hypothetical protein
MSTITRDETLICYNDWGRVSLWSSATAGH